MIRLPIIINTVPVFIYRFTIITTIALTISIFINIGIRFPDMTRRIFKSVPRLPILIISCINIYIRNSISINIHIDVRTTISVCINVNIISRFVRCINNHNQSDYYYNLVISINIIEVNLTGTVLID